MILFPIVKCQQTFPKTNKETEFPLSIRLIVVEDASKGDSGMLRTAGGGDSGAPPTLRFSVKDSNRASTRSAGGDSSGAPRKMDECEGVKKRIVMEEKGRGGNGTLMNTCGGGSGAPPTMRFSVKDSNRASPRRSGGGGSGAPRTMEICEGGNEGGNGKKL